MSDAPPVTPAPPQETLPPRSGLAIASIVLGGLGFCSAGLLSLVGLILGIVAMAGPRKAGGKAIAGVIISATSLVIAPIVTLMLMFALLLPGLATAQMNARSMKETAQLRELGIALYAYAADHDGRFPSADTWLTELVDDAYVTDDLVVSGLDPGGGPAFAMNQALGGRTMDAVSGPDIVLVFEIDPGGPTTGGQDLLPLRPRFPNQGYLILFTDGSVTMVPDHRLDSLTWEP